MSSFGKRLKEWRTRRDLSQEQLAAVAHISKSYVQGLEGGYRDKPSMEVVMRLAKALHVPDSALTGSDEDEKKSVSDLLRDLSERCRILETTQVPLRGTAPVVMG